jgi:signal-transduction protein with cAMP-binding, CBS, and nucleotidyltransferase domain
VSFSRKVLRITGKNVAKSLSEGRHSFMKSIQPFIHKKVIVLHDDATVEQAARAMREHQIGCILVSDHSSHIAGIVTDRDLVNGVLATGAKSLDQLNLAEVMTRNPLCVSEQADLK